MAFSSSGFGAGTSAWRQLLASSLRNVLRQRLRLARRTRALCPSLERGGSVLEGRSLLSVTFKPFPTGAATGFVTYTGITNGPGGDLWFVFRNNGFPPSKTEIGSVNPTTGQVTVIPLPQATGEGFLGAITADSSGDLWFVDDASDLLEEYTPATAAFRETMLPLPTPFSSLGEVAFGPNQSVWVANPDDHQLDEINPQTLAVTPFTAPNNLFPFGLAVGPDNALWFTTFSATIGRFDPASSTFQTFTAPLGNSSTTGITTGPGNRLYFTDSNNSAIGVITPAGLASTIQEFPVPASDVNPEFTPLNLPITAGADGNIWFAFNQATEGIGSFNPSTHAFNVFADTTDGSSATEAIVSGPDGNLWFTDDASNIIQAVSTGGGGGGGGGGTAPVITSTQDAFQTITTGKGKHARHKRVFEGFTLTFNEALDPTAAGNAGNYTVLVKSKHGKKTVTSPIRVQVNYSAGSDTVTILTGKQTFAHGGELKVNGSPRSGITDASGAFFLTGNTTFTISQRARSIGP